MKKLIRTLQWKFDYYIGYFLYNPRNRHRYHRYMYTKYPEKYPDPTYFEDEYL